MMSTLTTAAQSCRAQLMFHWDLLVSAQQLHATLCCAALLPVELLQLFYIVSIVQNVFLGENLICTHASASSAKCIPAIFFYSILNTHADDSDVPVVLSWAGFCSSAKHLRESLASWRSINKQKEKHIHKAHQISKQDITVIDYKKQ